MSVNSNTTTQTYAGNGAVLTFPIPFDFQQNNQVSVVLRNNNVNPAVDVAQTVGVEYTITGGDPGHDVQMGAAPGAGYDLIISRVTARTQPFDFTNDGTNFPEEFEEALDYLEMQIQELEAGSTIGTTVPGWSEQVEQVVANGDRISISATAGRQFKFIQGSGGPASPDGVQQIDDGAINGQELRLIGNSDDNPVSLDTVGNVELNGSAELKQYDTLDLFWVASKFKWIETTRSV